MIFTLFKRTFEKLQSQINIIIALSIYERERKSSESAVGAWEPLMQPLQLLLFLLVIRIGLKLLLKSPGNVLSTDPASVGSELYFDPITFLVTGLSVVFLFRSVALKSINGLKLKAPLFYRRVKPIDILFASALNDVRALATLSVLGLALSWGIRWTFQFDRPGLAISVYLLTVIMAVGFGICILFLGHYVPFIKRLVKRILQRIIIWTSGIFFATFELAPQIRPLITWNPILHGVELFRYSINDSYPIPSISFQYLITCSLLCASFALILYRVNESMLLESSDD